MSRGKWKKYKGIEAEILKILGDDVKTARAISEEIKKKGKKYSWRTVTESLKAMESRERIDSTKVKRGTRVFVLWRAR